VRLVIAVLLALTVTLDAQAPPQEFEVAPVTPSPQSSGPLFEVVSIKPAGSPTLPPIIASMLLVRSRRVQAQAITAAKLLAVAFPVDGHERLPNRIIGGPPWLHTTQFAFIATARDGVSEATLVSELPALLRGVLETRFKLKGHTELRLLPVYALMPIRRGAALGPQLHPTAGGTFPWSSYGRDYVSAYGTPISSFARSLTTLNLTDRPVIDRTGLEGAFDLDLCWSPQETAVTTAACSGDPDGPSLFTALQDQLGLRLVPSTERLEVFVIDHIERPTEN
jgi:bla regulator protein BlaR1